MPAQYELDVKQGENILPVRAGYPFNHILFGIRFVRIGVKRRLGNDLQPNARVYRPFEGLKAALAFQQRPSRDPNSQESLARGVFFAQHRPLHQGIRLFGQPREETTQGTNATAAPKSPPTTD